VRTPTPAPKRLVVCSSEPLTVSPFAPSQTSDDLLALFYEPPLERVEYEWQPRLVERVPSLEGGDVATRTVTVPQGRRYVDLTGSVRTHEGEESLRLPQLVVTFTLRNDLRWSDGESLTAEDVLLGYHLAQEPQARGRWRELVERTVRFEALDDFTLRWTGMPGYRTTDYPGFLFPPQPSHRWQGLRLVQVLEDRAPLATGPFYIDRWEDAGIRMRPNPHYAGDASLLEELVVLFPDGREVSWPALLASGECDVVLPDPAMSVAWRDWAPVVVEGAGVIWASTGPEPTFLRLDFNLAPTDEESAPLADPQVRAALAACVGRGRLVEALPGEALLPAEAFVPPRHPAFPSGTLNRVSQGTAVGAALLEGIGWQDEDGDGVREAHDVPDIAEGRPLSLTLILAPQYAVPAAYVVADLEACGVEVVSEPTDVRVLYAADPASPLFGRTFDLALYGWLAEPPQVCGAWRSDRIPQEENEWIGENFSGYESEAYDEACRRALAAVDAAVQREALGEAAAILSRDLPTLFLVWRPFWFVAHPRVQGVRPDPSNPAAIWNPEELDVVD
jgi:peptide/nickel transport system substrate-binding protein